MITQLEADEIESVLRAEAVGRIGCSLDGRVYVVPISYVYRDGYVYGHSAMGEKVRILRQNPQVCFEVDYAADLANWHSVIAWGSYEELSGEAGQRGMQLLLEGLSDRLPKGVIHGGSSASTGDGDAVVFRIKLDEITGRQERLYWGLEPPVTDAGESAGQPR